MSESVEDQPSAGPSRCSRMSSRCGRTCCRVVRILKYIAVLIFLVVVYLSLVGVPASVTERVKAALADEGVALTFDRLRLDMRRGLVADQVTLGAVDSPDEVGMTCRELHVNLNWTGWRETREWLQGLGVRDGVLYPGALSILPRDLDQPWLVMSNLTTFITFRGEEIHLAPFSAVIHGLPVEGQGVVRHAVFLDRAASGTGFEQGVKKAAVAIERPDIKHFLDRLWPVLAELTWSRDSLVTFDFSINPAAHAEDQVTIQAGGSGVTMRGQSFTDWRGEVELKGPHLDLKELSLGQEDQRARLSGSLHLQTKEIELHGYSGLDPACLLSLIPWGWASAVQDAIHIREGSLETECWIGPVQFKDMASAVRGWSKLTKSTYRGIWIEEGFASWTLQAPTITLDRLKFLCGEGREQGLIEGSFEMDVASKEWTADLVTRLDPHALLPVTPIKLVKLTQKFEFNESNPTIALQLAARGTPKPRLTFTGNFEAGDFSYQGVPGLTTESGIAYSNRVTRLDPFFVKRDEGEVTGWLTVDGKTKYSDFDLKSSIHPQAMGQLVHTNIGRIVGKLGVEGIGRWAASGRADYGAKTNSDYLVTARMHEARLWRLKSRDLDLSFSSLTTNLQFRMSESEWYGGSFTGKIDIAQTTPDWGYTAQFSVSTAQFNQVLTVIKPEEVPGMEGVLSGDAQFAGSLKPFQLPGSTGSGTLRISNGTIFRLPILGGLSVFLSKIFPGLGYSSQRDLTASFELRDEKIYSDDINISGRIASLQMDGRYHIGHDLDFDVSGQPLGRGVVADVVQLITMPISKLLEFQLQGTMQNPEWKAKHWPKELLTDGSQTGVGYE